MTMKETTREYRALLFDFYGQMLTGAQKETYAEHILEDLTVSEIAQNKNVSRQAVSDLIKRTERILSDYEDKLKLVERFLQIKEKVKEIERLATERDMKDIGNLAEEILEEL